MAFENGRILRGAAVPLGMIAMGGGAASAAAADLASETPAQVLAQVSAAIKGAKSFELEGVVHQASGKTEKLQLIDAGKSAQSITLTQNGSTITVLAVGGRSYFKASASFWAAHGTGRKLAPAYARRWYKVPNSEFTSLSKSLSKFAPSNFANCIGAGHGPLSNLGAQTVNGQAVVVLRDAGGKPGTTPGTLAIAATGAPYPLQVRATGPTLAGGPVNQCADGKASKAIGTITLSHWNSAPAVKAPAHATTLPH